MARPVVQSSQTATTTSASSVTITKPTGLAVGDFMFAFIGFENGSTARTFTTPSGWTLLQTNPTDSEGVACFYKEATSGDVAASNFTFSLSGAADRLGGVLVRVDTLADGNEIGASEFDEAVGPTGTSISFTTNLTAISSQSLYLACFFATDQTLSGLLSMSTYTITPSETITEIADIAQGTTVGYGLAVVSAPVDTDTITNRTAVTSQDTTEQKMSIAMVLNGAEDASITVSPLILTSTTPNPTITGDSNVTVDSIEINSTTPDPTIDTTGGKNWTARSKGSGSWTPRNK